MARLRGLRLRRRRGAAARAAAPPGLQRRSSAKAFARSRRRGEQQRRWSLLPRAEETDLAGATRVPNHCRLRRTLHPQAALALPASSIDFMEKIELLEAAGEADLELGLAGGLRGREGWGCA
ncbi:hypothetical protein OsI_37719 [Oryza sativa Indica Group]|uniref:Uncharacterized protein n=1 Tax=Oryza sativa subsp. indica TaxID=39946 RepID=A2ZIR7_ORYSI|nr:hypothetical protein OsI_37719 [Oryza sativa Indica Group]